METALGVGAGFRQPLVLPRIDPHTRAGNWFTLRADNRPDQRTQRRCLIGR